MTPFESIRVGLSSTEVEDVYQALDLFETHFTDEESFIRCLTEVNYKNTWDTNYWDNLLREVKRRYRHHPEIISMWILGNYCKYKMIPHDEYCQIDIRGKNITKFPSNFHELVDLVHLQLVNVGLKEIPKGFENFYNLESLYLSHNKIQEIPKEIGECVSLKKLIIPDNSLQSLPKEITNCDLLKLLSLADNKNLSFPMEILELKNLERLYLGHCAIVEIPPEISELKKLEILNLDGLPLGGIPQQVLNLPNLETLSLRNTELPQPYLEDIEAYCSALKPPIKVSIR